MLLVWNSNTIDFRTYPKQNLSETITNFTISKKQIYIFFMKEFICMKGNGIQWVTKHRSCFYCVMLGQGHHQKKMSLLSCREDMFKKKLCPLRFAKIRTVRNSLNLPILHLVWKVASLNIYYNLKLSDWASSPSGMLSLLPTLSHFFPDFHGHCEPRLNVLFNNKSYLERLNHFPRNFFKR